MGRKVDSKEGIKEWRPWKEPAGTRTANFSTRLHSLAKNGIRSGDVQLPLRRRLYPDFIVQTQGTLILILKGDGSVTDLTSCPYRIYLIGIRRFYACNIFFPFWNNLVQTCWDRRSVVRNTYSFRIKTGVLVPGPIQVIACLTAAWTSAMRVPKLNGSLIEPLISITLLSWLAF